MSKNNSKAKDVLTAAGIGELGRDLYLLVAGIDVALDALRLQAKIKGFKPPQEDWRVNTFELMAAQNSYDIDELHSKLGAAA
ncbi:hypothetical protein [Sulfitobacter sp. 1A15106]|uniref:hypothetical protein n=1 Tax=Sulfitobacter sp. 1A15106 TaxID=3368590 RepID=UPI0037459823